MTVGPVILLPLVYDDLNRLPASRRRIATHYDARRTHGPSWKVSRWFCNGKGFYEDTSRHRISSYQAPPLCGSLASADYPECRVRSYGTNCADYVPHRQEISSSQSSPCRSPSCFSEVTAKGASSYIHDVSTMRSCDPFYVWSGLLHAPCSGPPSVHCPLLRRSLNVPIYRGHAGWIKHFFGFSNLRGYLDLASVQETWLWLFETIIATWIVSNSELLEGSKYDIS
jgi:hypothetical protein